MKYAIRHSLLIAVFVMLTALRVMAQNYPTAEVSGGFSYLRVQRGANLYGWDASVAGNLNRWFGLVGEFSGHYGSGSATSPIPVTFGGPIILPAPITFDVSSSSNVYTFLFGPRLSYRKDKRLTPFAHVLPGFARSAFSVTLNAPPINIHTSASSTGFAMAVGGGLDVGLTKSLAFRLIQGDYLLTHFGSATQNNGRITTGLVYKF
jgi:hypothetical protein